MTIFDFCKTFYNYNFSFFLRSFSPLSFGFFLTDTGDSQGSRKKEWFIFISLYNFHSLTNQRHVFAVYLCEMSTLYFKLQCMQLPVCFSMRFIGFMRFWLCVNCTLIVYFTSDLRIKDF